MIKLTINGKEIQSEKNKTVLDVVREQNLAEIPTMCQSDLLEPFTSCFLCVIEIDGVRGLKPACATQVVDGMVVRTDTDRIKESRKANLELLLSNHRADCYPPCRLYCPANMDIQGYIALNARGLYYEGQKLMKETNPLTMVCGRVCARPCEDACRRNFVDEPLDIKNIKRYMADLNLSSENIYMPECAPDTGKKVAVIGSGPAGLSAAYYLRQNGHSVTIFERLPDSGGMMRYGIPEYRLPKADLAKEVGSIVKMGAQIKYNTELGKDITIDGLFKDKYNAIFLGIGAQLGTSSGVSGSDLEGVMQGVDFLRDVTLGKDIKIFGTVFVIGGGNTAIDASRTALRLGADKVVIIYRRSETEMPADKEEIHDAKEEGVELKILTNPLEYIGENGKLTSVKCTKMELCEPDASGRRGCRPLEGCDFVEKADFVIEALGQKIDASGLEGIKIGSKGTIIADQHLFTTSRDGVFAGGDAVTGPYIIIGAVAQGRKAAYVIDRYLNGLPLERENRLGFYIRKEDFGELSPDEFKDVPKMPRNKIRKVAAEERKNSFIEVEKGFTEADVLKEASRCMECGCQDIYECRLKEYSGKYGADKKHFLGGSYRQKKYDSGNKYILINTEKCVNCGLCVRLCAEVQKQAVFSFDKRGFSTTPVPYMYKALTDANCIECGLCAASCPVGAITEKLPMGKPGPFENRLTESACNLCGDGCSISVDSRNGNFMKISSKIGGNKNLDILCKTGRFGYEKFLENKPNSVQGGTADDVKKFISALKPESTLISISPRSTAEEIELVFNFASAKGIALYSQELGADSERIDILESAGLPLVKKAEKNYSQYKNIYYFGSFNEEINSVEFRKLIRNDRVQNIFISADLKSKYFRYEKFASDMALFEYMKSHLDTESLIAFNLQNIEIPAFKELAKYLKENRSDYAMLNSHVNYSLVADKIKDISQINENIGNKRYDTLISIYEAQQAVKDNFKEKIIFSDSNISSNSKYFIPLKSIYGRSGKFFDQFGNEKMIIMGSEDAGYKLGEFFI